MPQAVVSTELLVTWHAGWDVVVAPVFDSPECQAAEIAADRIINAWEANAGFVSARCREAPNAANGCLLTFQQQSVVGQTVGPELALYYRFGVVLTGNDSARQAFPSLPQPDTRERALLPALGSS
jgi:hypothetical protein